jgi:hypothetical protein
MIARRLSLRSDSWTAAWVIGLGCGTNHETSVSAQAITHRSSSVDTSPVMADEPRVASGGAVDGPTPRAPLSLDLSWRLIAPARATLEARPISVVNGVFAR